MDQRIVDAVTRSGAPDSLSDRELELGTQPLTRAAVPGPVRAWVTYGGEAIAVDALAWTEYAVATRWSTADGEHRAWVWTSAVRVDGIEIDLISYCRNQYRATRELGGMWRISGLTSIYERDTLSTALPATTVPFSASELDGFRPSYRYLAWYQAKLGLILREDLLGDDSPDGVARQYSAERVWLQN